MCSSLPSIKRQKNYQSSSVPWQSSSPKPSHQLYLDVVTITKPLLTGGSNNLQSSFFRIYSYLTFQAFLVLRRYQRSQSDSQPVSQSISQPVSQPVSQSVSQSDSQEKLPLSHHILWVTSNISSSLSVSNYCLTSYIIFFYSFHKFKRSSLYSIQSAPANFKKYITQSPASITLIFEITSNHGIFSTRDKLSLQCHCLVTAEAVHTN